MKISIAYITGAYLLLIPGASALFSVYDDYYSSPKYTMKYKDHEFLTKVESTELLSGESNVGRSYYLMQSSNTNYMCHIPQVSNNQSQDPFANIEGKGRSEKIEIAVKHIKDTLSNKWIFHHLGYWTFAFKFGQELSQFHGWEKEFIENKTPKYFLGVPDRKEDYNDYSLHKEGGVWFLRYNLKDGTICDLTGRPRSAEVQFMCDPSQTEPTLNWVKEYKSCQYHAQISVPQLCSDDLFGMNKDEKIHEIECTKIIDPETDFLTKDELLQKPFTDHASEIFIEDYDLIPLGNGVFMGIPDTGNKTNIFISNAEEMGQDLLGKVSSAYVKGLISSKIKVPVESGSLLDKHLIASLVYETYVYNVKGKYLSTVQVHWREDGQLMASTKKGLSMLKSNFKKILGENNNAVVGDPLDDESAEVSEPDELKENKVEGEEETKEEVKEVVVEVNEEVKQEVVDEEAARDTTVEESVAESRDKEIVHDEL